MKIIGIVTLALLTLTGCESSKCVVTSAQSVLGIGVTENQATQLYEARAGIVVSQVAVVPCNTNNGFVPDVVQEFKVNNLFAGGLVYQRLAVGSNAVSQPGAAMMFCKDGSGNVSTNLVQAWVGQYLTKQPK